MAMSAGLMEWPQEEAAESEEDKFRSTVKKVYNWPQLVGNASSDLCRVLLQLYFT